MCAVGETLRCGSLSLLRAFPVQNAQYPADASRRLADPGRTEKRLQEERSNRSCPIRSGPAVDTSGRTTGIRDTAAHSSDSRKTDPFEFLYSQGDPDRTDQVSRSSDQVVWDRPHRSRTAIALTSVLPERGVPSDSRASGLPSIF